MNRVAPATHSGGRARFFFSGWATLLAAFGALVGVAAAAAGASIAVGYNGALLASPDGASWSVIPPVTGAALFDVAQGERLVAVGSGGTVLTSSDTVNWASQTVTPQWFLSVATNGDDWLAVGTGGVRAASSDGLSWNLLPGGPTSSLHGVDTSGPVWVAVGAGGTVLRSAGPPSWTWTTVCPGGPTCTTATLRAVAYGAGTWVAVGDGGAIRTSGDGITWASVNGASGADLEDVAWSGSAWVAVGAGGAVRVSTSLNAGSWGAPASATPQPLRGVAAPCGSGPWVTAGGAGTLLTSPGAPGWSWAPPGSPSGENLEGITCILDCLPLSQTVLANDPVNLSATGSATYTWTAPGSTNPGPVTGASFSTTYTVPGTYAVSVAGGGSPPRVVQCQVIVLPRLQCSPASLTVGQGNGLTLSAANGNPPYSWSAPGSSNPGPAAGASLSISYASAGTYTVTLADAGSPAQSTQCTITVSPPPPACMPGPQNVLIGDIASFGAVGGAAPYVWSAPGSDNPGPAAGASFATTYSSVGAYTVTVQDDQVPAQSAQCPVQVQAPPLLCTPPTQSVGLDTPFTLSATSGVAPYSWAVPGAGTVAGPGLTWTFATPGTRAFTLTDAVPGRSTTCAVDVLPDCPEAIQASFTALADGAVAGRPLGFRDASSGPVASWSWDFGDGGVAAEPEPMHTFAQAGTFHVRLTVQGQWCPETSIAETEVRVAGGGEPWSEGGPGAGPIGSSGVSGPPRADDANEPAGHESASAVPLVAVAGPMRTSSPGETIVLEGSATGPEGVPLQYEWAQVEGPTVALEPLTAGRATFVVPGGLEGERFGFQLTVSAGHAVAQDSTFVLVIPAQAAAGTEPPSSPDGQGVPASSPPVQSAASVPWLPLAAAFLAILAFGVFLAARRRRGGPQG